MDRSATEKTPKPMQHFWGWLPQLRREIWILAAGQLLLYLGQGFTLVYASIYFVNQLGFSTTQVGLALGSSGLAGILGRFWAGSAIDAARWGRRGTLLLAAVLTALGCFVLASAATFPLLIVGNLLLGLGVSLYWPATLAVTTDLTTAANRTEAFALTRLVDNLGLGLGAFLAGQYMAMSGSYGLLFVIKGITYLLFAGVIYAAIAETRPAATVAPNGMGDWRVVICDRTFLTYLTGNLIFTLYAAQHTSTLPLYLANFIPAGNTTTGFSEQWIGYFFVWHALLKIVFQLPVTRAVQAINHVTILLVALGLWSGGFLLIWGAGVSLTQPLLFAGLAFTLIALAEVLYSPAGVSLVGEMAPENLRGMYFAMESQCWGLGFIIGPAMGGWALDQPGLATHFWLLIIVGGGLASGLLVSLRQQLMGRAADALTVER
ncbi:MAG: MFS transporter [Cyanobacteria bacterium J06648_16]